MDNKAEDSALKSILKSLKSIEDQSSNVEIKLQIQTELVEDGVQPIQKVIKPIADDDLEIRLGEYWIPKVTFVVFNIWMDFFLTFPLKGLPTGFPSVNKAKLSREEAIDEFYYRRVSLGFSTIVVTLLVIGLYIKLKKVEKKSLKKK